MFLDSAMILQEIVAIFIAVGLASQIFAQCKKTDLLLPFSCYRFYNGNLSNFPLSLKLP